MGILSKLWNFKRAAISYLYYNSRTIKKGIVHMKLFYSTKYHSTYICAPGVLIGMVFHADIHNNEEENSIHICESH